LQRLKSLGADYDALLQQLQEDPNLLERLGPATLGTGRNDGNTVYPRVMPEQLDAARKALTEEPRQEGPEPTMPRWLTRCKEPSRRVSLFAAGAVLILISFMWFGSVDNKSTKPEQPK